MNKRSYLWIIIILIILNIFSLSIIWFGHIKNQNHRHDLSESNSEQFKERDSNFLSNELNLNEEQTKIIKGLRQEHRLNIKKTQKAIFKKKKLFIEESFSEESNDSLLNIYAQELGELQKELELFNKDHILKMKELLNLKQTKKFNKLFREMMLRADPESKHKRKHDKKDKRRVEKPE